MANKQIHVIGGGTIYHIRPHFAICSPAYGETARRLGNSFQDMSKMDVCLHLTKMAGGEYETNEDIAKLVDKLVANPLTKIIVMSAALCDYEGYVTDGPIPTASGKYEPRLHSRDQKTDVNIKFLAGDKIISRIRKKRKDIFLVAFKATSGLDEDAQYIAGLNLLKESSANLVLANDMKTRLNMVVTPEEARYHVTTNRKEALEGLVEMALLRSHLTFTRSTVVAGKPVPWDSPEVPMALRIVVNHCIGKDAYKPFRGSTVGHFACKVSDNEFLTSIRKTNFNDLEKTGLVRIKTDGPDSVIAYGSKPSVGGQSQRILFHDHKEYDCVVHFHCPLKEGHRDDIPVRSQREVECGSHECGKNTSNGLKKFSVVRNPKIAGLDVPQEFGCVMLDQHGPNIVFNRSIDPLAVIDFIEANFDLSQKTGGYVTPDYKLSNILDAAETLK